MSHVIVKVDLCPLNNMILSDVLIGTPNNVNASVESPDPTNTVKMRLLNLQVQPTLVNSPVSKVH